MGKKRKTRQQKIILQLKRQLEARSRPSQEAILIPVKKAPVQKVSLGKSDNSAFFYAPSLIKKDILKTLALTFFIISLELVLYLKLR